MELDDEVDVRVEAPDAVARTLEPYLASVEAETRSKIDFGPLPAGAASLPVDLDSGIGARRLDAESRCPLGLAEHHGGQVTGP